MKGEKERGIASVFKLWVKCNKCMRGRVRERDREREIHQTSAKQLKVSTLHSQARGNTIGPPTPEGVVFISLCCP